MEIKPLLMPSIDWTTWNTCRSLLNEVPASRSLEIAQANLRAPHALCLALDAGSLRHAQDQVLGMAQLGFLLYTDPSDDILSILACYTGSWHLNQLSKCNEITMVTTLVQWRASLISGSRSNDTIVRQWSNMTYSLMATAGLADLWYQYRRVNNADKTFTFQQ